MPEIYQPPLDRAVERQLQRLVERRTGACRIVTPAWVPLSYRFRTQGGFRLDLGAFRVMLERSTLSGGRSTALQPLQWMLGLSLAAAVSAGTLKGRGWVLVTLMCFAGISLLVFICTYVYLVLTDRDSVRSERFALQKMAMEKGLLGDSERGLRDVTTDTELPAITSGGESER